MAGVRTKLIVDCDPGHDDAVALLFAARHFDLLAVTNVFGKALVQHSVLWALAERGLSV
jgi:inosine-uridine nucleoside N-ribohydrolase